MTTRIYCYITHGNLRKTKHISYNLKIVSMKRKTIIVDYSMCYIASNSLFPEHIRRLIKSKGGRQALTDCFYVPYG